VSALPLLLSSFLATANDPARVCGEVVPPGPLELPDHWVGAWGSEGGTEGGAVLEGRRLTLPMMPAWTVPLVLVDEGDGGDDATGPRRPRASPLPHSRLSG
jgi:hypothetical protein